MRCAYCHDALDLRARPCEACGTHLHSECWRLARRGCPTLGCTGRQERRKRRPRNRRRHARGRSSSFVPVGMAIGVGTSIPALGFSVLALILAELNRSSGPGPLFAVLAALFMVAAHFLLVPALWFAQELRDREPGEPRRFGERYRQALGLQGIGLVQLGALSAISIGGLAILDMGGLAALLALPTLVLGPAVASWLGDRLHQERTPDRRSPRRANARPEPVAVSALPIVVRPRPVIFIQPLSASDLAPSASETRRLPRPELPEPADALDAYALDALAEDDAEPDALPLAPVAPEPEPEPELSEDAEPEPEPPVPAAGAILLAA